MSGDIVGKVPFRIRTILIVHSGQPVVVVVVEVLAHRILAAGWVRSALMRKEPVLTMPVVARRCEAVTPVDDGVRTDRAIQCIVLSPFERFEAVIVDRLRACVR